MSSQKQNWSKVIALRITDELAIKDDFPEDTKEILRNALKGEFLTKD